jgi:acetyl esterase/lipase
MLGLLLAVRPAAGGLDAFVLDSTPMSADGLYAGLLGPTAALIVQPVIRRLIEEARSRAFPEGRLVVKSRGWPPVLLVHGELDRHVPVEQSELVLKMLREAGGDGNCEFWRIPGADHLAGLDVAGAAYSDRALDWFDRWFSAEGRIEGNSIWPGRAWLVPVSEGGTLE